MTPISRETTFGEKYGPAMTVKTQEDADAYFNRCVEHTMLFGKTREQAETIERHNLGYWAGHYGAEVRERIERLFKCKHPVFGAIAEKGQPSVADAFEKGRMWAEERRKS